MEQPQQIRPYAVYTLRDTCRLLSIGNSTARCWLRQGLLPARKIGGHYRFLGIDLLRALGAPDVLGWSMPEDAESTLAAIGVNRDAIRALPPRD